MTSSILNYETHRRLFEKFRFVPVIHFPEEYEVYDFSNGYDPRRPLKSPYGVGRYNEKRPGMYATELFTSQTEGPRDIHIGIDLAAPAGTPVHAFMDGVIEFRDINPAPGDYGGTIITRHDLNGVSLWALYGHLSHASARHKNPGERVKAGEVLGWLGEATENGGWNPHLHLQLSLEKPDRCDMPGAVNEKDLDHALRTYPDPRHVLGPLY